MIEALGDYTVSPKEGGEAISTQHQLCPSVCVKGVLVVVVVTVPAGNKHKSSVSKEGSVVSSHIRNWKVY